MGCKHCKSEDLNEKEHENSIGDHRLARSKEQEVKKKLGRISRENDPKKEKKSAYNEQKKQIIDKRLSEFTERDKNKRSAKKPINGIKGERHPDEILIPRAENGYFSSRSSLWDAFPLQLFENCMGRSSVTRPMSRSSVTMPIRSSVAMPSGNAYLSNGYTQPNGLPQINGSDTSSLWHAVEAEDHYPTFPHVQVPSYIHSLAPPTPDHLDDLYHGYVQSHCFHEINGSDTSSLWHAVEAEDHYPTFPHVQVPSPYIHSLAPPPPDHLDDLNPGSQQQQQIYNPPPVIENNIPHSIVLSALIPPSAPLHQDLLDDLNPNNQQQQHAIFTPSDIENDVFDEDLPPNPNPAPPPPDYLE